MPGDQELRCAEAICKSLNEFNDRAWKIECWLDDKHQDEAGPDVRLSDGDVSIAVEIKQLTDGSEFHEFAQYSHSLYRRLALDPDRDYLLIPAPSTRLPLPESWLPRIRTAIADSGPALRVGEEAKLRIPRRSKLSRYGDFKPGVVGCQHDSAHSIHQTIPDAVGAFILEDGGEPARQFLSEDLRTAFRRELERACDSSKRDGLAVVSWQEEWHLLRLSDPPLGSGGVHVAAATACFLETAVIECVETAVRSAKSKFNARRWANHTAAALHASEQQSKVPITYFDSAIRGLKADQIRPLDFVLLVRGPPLHGHGQTASEAFCDGPERSVRASGAIARIEKHSRQSSLDLAYDLRFESPSP